MEYFKIYDQIIKSFESFLENKNNERIIFSGKFGSGKTTFLNEFFKAKKKYNVFKLYPVNYSVENNKDIFSLIKYDILIKLITDYNFKPSKAKVSAINYIPKYLGEHAYKLLLPILTLKVPILGPKIYSILNAEIKDFKEEYSKEDGSISDDDVMQNFSAEIINSEGNIYEYNYLTDLIREGLEVIGDVDSESVLLIDDLDRVDPNSIFRLLNIFASHFEGNTEFVKGKNKFGFDKIIFVCDIENIKHIYGHLYGENTDFSGYIDKFFSTNIYKFDSRSNLSEIVNQVLNSNVIKYQEHDIRGKNYENQIHPFEKKVISLILQEMIEQRFLKIRNFVKYDSEYIINSKSYNFEWSSQTIFNFQFSVFWVVQYLILLCGDLEVLKNFLDKNIGNDNIMDNTINAFFLDCCMVLLLSDQHNFILNEKISVEVSPEFIGFQGKDEILALELSNPQALHKYFYSHSEFKNFKPKNFYKALLSCIAKLEDWNFV